MTSVILMGRRMSFTKRMMPPVCSLRYVSAQRGLRSSVSSHGSQGTLTEGGQHEQPRFEVDRVKRQTFAMTFLPAQDGLK